MRKFVGAAFASVICGILCSLGGYSALADDAKWTGAYAGGHIGRLSGAAKEILSAPVEVLGVEAVDAGPVIDSRILHMSDSIGGAHAGYNLVQQGPYVFGVEGDFDWTRTRDGTASSSTTLIGPETNDDGVRAITTSLSFGTSESFIRELDRLSSVRARAGVADSSFLLYLTGGIAFASAKATNSSGSSFNFDSTCTGDCVDVPPVHISSNFSTTTAGRQSLLGYVIGGGVELKLTDELVGRVEYLYYDFGRETFSFKPEDGDPFTRKFDIHENVFRVGLSYYLN